MPTDPQDAALLELLRALKARDYAFVTPTQATHRANVRRRGEARARNLRDVFGWGLPFSEAAPGPELLALLREAEAVRSGRSGERSAVRVASLKGDLFLNAPGGEQAVFFGPDSYRFAEVIAREAAGFSPRRIVDVGTGSGVGGLVAARLHPKARIVLTDVNPRALRLARINAAAAGMEVESAEGPGVSAVTGDFDLALLNPPFIAGSAGATYKDGGEMHGARLAIDLAREIVGRLTPGGRLILYTGSAIVEGRDAQREALAAIPDATLSYREIDPDIFGGMLGSDAYRDVERIAAVSAVLSKRD